MQIKIKEMKNIFKNILVVIMLLTLNFTAKAQDGNPDNPLSEDPGAAPIGDYVPLMLVAAVGLGYFLIRKKLAKQA